MTRRVMPRRVMPKRVLTDPAARPLTDVAPLCQNHALDEPLASKPSRAPSVGFEPTQPAPEAGALSPELRGPGPLTLQPQRPNTGPVGSLVMPATILVVDDDPVIQKLLAVNFEMEGYRVVTAGDGEEALAQVASEQPDAVVLDVMMPKIDGIEVVRRMRADAAAAAIPVLLLSARAQAKDIAEGLDAGADAYMTKPFDPLDLLERVASLIGRGAA